MSALCCPVIWAWLARVYSGWSVMVTCVVIRGVGASASDVRASDAAAPQSAHVTQYSITSILVWSVDEDDSNWHGSFQLSPAIPAMGSWQVWRCSVNISAPFSAAWPCTQWMKTIHYLARPEIQKPLPEWNNRCGSESSTLKTNVYVWHYTPLVVHATKEEEEVSKQPVTCEWGALNTRSRGRRVSDHFQGECCLDI